VHISLEAMEAIHLDWAGGAPMPGLAIPADMARKFDLAPKQVTAALVGLKSRAAVFRVQRFVADYPGEALMAVLPGVALDQLWDVVGVGERVLMGMSAMIAAVSFAGLVAVIFAGLNERRRELAVLRAVGAAPRQVLLLLTVEGSLVALLGASLGAVALGLGVLVAGPAIQAHYGIVIGHSAPTAREFALFAEVVAAGLFASLAPALRAYRLSLVDGLSPQV
jgi:putative ABC transport system permease protein